MWKWQCQGSQPGLLDQILGSVPTVPTSLGQGEDASPDSASFLSFSRQPHKALWNFWEQTGKSNHEPFPVVSLTDKWWSWQKWIFSQKHGSTLISLPYCHPESDSHTKLPALHRVQNPSLILTHWIFVFSSCCRQSSEASSCPGVEAKPLSLAFEAPL